MKAWVHKSASALASGAEGVRVLAQAASEAGGLNALLDEIGDAQVVCIGEASHGTH